MNQKRCNRCGTVVEATDKFCYKCGFSEFTNVVPVASSVNPIQPTNIQPPQQPQQLQSQQPSPLQQPQQPQQQFTPQPPNIAQMQPQYIAQQPIFDQQANVQNKNKGAKWWKIALIAVAALFVLILVISSIGGNESGGNNVGGDFGGENFGGNTNDTPNYTYNGSTDSVATKTKTVMIYVVGSDLETIISAASYDITEMINSGVDTTKNKVLIYTGGAKSWHITGIPNNKNCIYLLDGKEFKLVKDYKASNMASSQPLAEFLKYGASNYPSDEYGLILWNHGGGPMVGYGKDELHNGDLLTMSELKSALADSGFGKQKKLEFLGFDACLMGSIETAWVVKDYANYFIASQETEPGVGWDYSFLKQLDHYDGGKDIGKCIIDSYIEKCEALARQNPTLRSELTLSCLDLSKIDKVEDSLNDLFAKVDYNILNGYFPTASQHRSSVKSFGKFASSSEYDLIDIAHLVSLLSPDYANEANQVKAALKELVTYSRANVKNTSGVSIYHPYDNPWEMKTWIAEFKRIGFATEYANYISNFGVMLSNPSSSSWKSFSKTMGNAINKGSDKELSIQLTEEQAKNYASSSYYILRKIKDDEYMFIFAGFDTELNSSGMLSASYNNKAVFAVNDKTNSVSNSPITMYQVRDGSGEQKYCASAIFWLFADDIVDWRTDPVEWQIKIENGTPEPLGAYLIEDTSGTGVPQKQLLNYKDYSSIEFSFSTRTPKTDSDGNLLPYFEWESTGNFYGNEYDVAEGFHFECREIDNKEDYYVMFVVKDVQGNSYASEMFTLPN